MRRARKVLLVAALASALAGEVTGRNVPVAPEWLEEIHPLLGAAPADSFARRPDADPWLDFAGKPFARALAPGERRVLLVGGAGAERLAERVRAQLGSTKLVVAARAGYSVVQEALLVGRFAPALGVSSVVAIDGDELASPPALAGWTPEWSWQDASLHEPWGEVLARRSGLARLLLVREPTPPPPEVARARYVLGVRELAALARARRLELDWACDPGEPISAETRREASRGVEGRGRAFPTAEELLAALAKGR